MAITACKPAYTSACDRLSVRGSFKASSIMPHAVFGKAGFSLHRRSVGHPAAPRAALPVTGDRCVDQPRIALRQRLVVEAEEAQRSRAKILHHDIGGVAELQRRFMPAAGNVQIDADIALSRILLRIITRHAVGGGKCEARHIRAWRLDFDDFGAEILQCPRAQRTCEHAGKVDDANSAERTSHDQRPANFGKAGAVLSERDKTGLQISDAQIGACTLAIASSAAATPSLTAM